MVTFKKKHFHVCLYHYMQHLLILRLLWPVQQNLYVSWYMRSVPSWKVKGSLLPWHMQKWPSSVTVSSQIPFFILSMLLGSQGKDNSFPFSSTIWLHYWPLFLPLHLWEEGYVFCWPHSKRHPRSTLTLPSRTGCLSSVGEKTMAASTTVSSTKF